jgi:hypothetical protein
LRFNDGRQKASAYGVPGPRIGNGSIELKTASDLLSWIQELLVTLRERITRKLKYFYNNKIKRKIVTKKPVWRVPPTIKNIRNRI